MSRLVGLYPEAWRARYGDEFQALLADRPPTVGERLDIVRSAVDARLRPQLPGPRRVADRFGLAPLAGFAMFAIVAILLSTGPVHSDDFGTYRDGSAALPFFVLALILLSIGLFRIVDRLPKAARWPRAAGWIAIVVGPMWAMAPWIAPIGLAFLLGVLGLGVGARRAGLWPTWGLILTVALLMVPAALFTAQLFLPWYALRVAGIALLGVSPIAGAWLVVGGLLLRGFPRPPQA
jgi:hypothetical protein